VYGGMDGIDFNGGHNFEARLLEAQTKASSSRKQVDSDWPWHLQSPALKYQLTRLRTGCRSEFFPAVPKRKRVAISIDPWTSSDIAKLSGLPNPIRAMHACFVCPCDDSSQASEAKIQVGTPAGDQFGIRGHAKSSR
jgi:hypothetical protein